VAEKKEKSKLFTHFPPKRDSCSSKQTPEIFNEQLKRNDFPFIPSSNYIDLDKYRNRKDSINLSQNGHTISVQENKDLDNSHIYRNRKKASISNEKEKKLATNFKMKIPNKFKLDLSSVKKKT